MKIQAQAYLEKFYGTLGFIREKGTDNVDLDAYDEDGIMHVDMVKLNKLL